MRTISREDVLYILNQYPLFRENFIKDLEITYNLRGGDIKQNFPEQKVQEILIPESTTQLTWTQSFCANVGLTTQAKTSKKRMGQ